MPLIQKDCDESCRTVIIPGKFNPATGKHGLPLAAESCKWVCVETGEETRLLATDSGAVGQPGGPLGVPGFEPNDADRCDPFSDFRRGWHGGGWAGGRGTV